MKKYDEDDGVWRTVGGRRIFIRTGQDLSSAMRKSGKFKFKRKMSSDDKDKRESEYNLYKRAVENPDSIDAMTENSTDWEALDKKYKGRYEKEQSGSKKDYEKYNDFLKEQGIDRQLSEKEYYNMSLKTQEVAVKGFEKSIEMEKENLERAKRNGASAADISNRTRAIHDLELEHQNAQYELNRLTKKFNDASSENTTGLGKSINALNDVDRIAGNDEKLQKLGRSMGASSFARWNNAFNEYKKEHPNTKLDLYKFIKMNTD